MLGLLRDVVLLNNNQQRRPTGFPELLTTNQQTGGDTNGNTGGFVGVDSVTPDNFTLTYDTTTSKEGAGSIKMLNTLDGENQLSIYFSDSKIVPLVTGIVPGAQYTFLTNVISSYAEINCVITVRWYNSSNTYLSQNGTAHTSPTSWTEKSVTATAPANAAKAIPLYLYYARAQNRYVNVDTSSFKRVS